MYIRAQLCCARVRTIGGILTTYYLHVIEYSLFGIPIHLRKPAVSSFAAKPFAVNTNRKTVHEKMMAGLLRCNHKVYWDQ